MSVNNSRDSNIFGALVVGAMFGILIGGVSIVVWDVGVPNGLIIGTIVAIVAFVVVWLGWREPLPKLGEPQPGAYDADKVDAAPTADGGVTVGNGQGASAASAAGASGAAGAAGASGSAAAASTSDNSATVDVTGEVPPSAASDQVSISATADVSAEAEPAPSGGAAATTAGAESSGGAPAATPSSGTDSVGGAPVAAEDGVAPTKLDGPRDGGADDLKQIKGVGPKLEQAVNGIGVYHFDQIAAWTAEEVAWVDENLIGFKGRVTRDDWVSQAKILAAGGETEFSKKVDKGGVY